MRTAHERRKAAYFSTLMKTANAYIAYRIMAICMDIGIVAIISNTIVSLEENIVYKVACFTPAAGCNLLKVYGIYP